MEKITHQMRSQQWSKIIAECLASGMNKTAWCKENGISDKQFFYWQRILRREAYELATSVNTEVQLPAASSNKPIPFVELKFNPASSESAMCTNFKPDAVIQANGILIGLANSASPDLIRSLGGILHVE